MPQPSFPAADVVVVGAGVSGLAAAERLLAHGVESLLVVEAADRVGGRTWNRTLRNGAVVEGGAMYVCESQRDICGLIERLSLDLFPMHKSGDSVAILGGERHVFAGAGPRVDPVAHAQLKTAVRAFDELVASLPPDASWSHPDAARLDRISLAAWRDERIVDPTARAQFDGMISGWTATPPARVSLLYALHAMATCGGVAAMLADQRETFRFAGGSQRLAETIAERLGDRVLLGSPVTAIDQSRGDGVTVHAGGVAIDAAHVIVALNGIGCRSVDFTPALPAARELLGHSWEPGPLVKANVIYDEPFWRADGLSGSASIDDGPFQGCLDSSPPDGSFGALTVVSFVFDEHERYGNPPAFHADPAVRRAASLDLLARFFGPRALEPIEYQETDWSREPFVFGCEGAVVPGRFTEIGDALLAPFERVHWAGTETATRWTGWMNGAVQAGERAAGEVLALR
ncbi:flavin monoamine oxidase family protein [Conexibacter woesei]|uniref:Amine oxidase n=1 Tax=Conexibacter woesei (strain DSM 14684 / CCUG 47730 / CIP 108061 / JCM 11494 / NBRC 100937 / ID131577) TaxID=469383 RepID=D3F4B9_CONWI|nr:FAD-dependent oxidoreductase [Conexibacter woesei]ADB50491.1 amine oxidase [Conexibacter woesei DSM 14684]